jgi:peptidoglycan-associated lipoprotein
MANLRRSIFALWGTLALALVLAGCAGNGPTVRGGGSGAVGMAEAPGGAAAPAAASGDLGSGAPGPERVAPRLVAPDEPGGGGRGGGGAAGRPAHPLQDVFFDTDRARIRGDGLAALRDNLAWLRANPGMRVTVEGHCDERGTSEYNLALGERRARAVRDYLVAAGIDPAHLTTVSFGKERPFVLGHDEAAWRWNRRAHFSVAYPQLTQWR